MPLTTGIPGALFPAASAVRGGPCGCRFALLAFVAFLATAPQTRAEYVVLRSGQRLSVTGYQRQGDTYHLQLNGGSADLPASEVVSIEPEDVFTKDLPPPAPAADAKARYREQILASASRYRVDPDLITSVIAVESNFDPRAVSRRNARGLMQLLPQTATQLGVKNVFDPTENIDAGTRYLSTLLDRYHYNLALTLAAYNAGPQSVQRYGRVPPYQETHSYIAKVSRTYAQRKSPSSLAAQPGVLTSGPRAKSKASTLSAKTTTRVKPSQP